MYQQEPVIECELRTHTQTCACWNSDPRVFAPLRSNSSVSLACIDTYSEKLLTLFFQENSNTYTLFNEYSHVALVTNADITSILPFRAQIYTEFHYTENINIWTTCDYKLLRWKEKKTYFWKHRDKKTKKRLVLIYRWSAQEYALLISLGSTFIYLQSSLKATRACLQQKKVREKKDYS